MVDGTKAGSDADIATFLSVGTYTGPLTVIGSTGETAAASVEVSVVDTVPLY